MTWILLPAVALGWLAMNLVLAMIIGRSVRLAERIEMESAEQVEPRQSAPIGRGNLRLVLP